MESASGSDSRPPEEVVRARRRAALDELLVRNLDRLRAFVRLRLGAFLREQESESDVVQSVCREILQHAERFEFQGERPFENWLYGAVLEKVRDHERFYRARKRGSGRTLSAANIDQLVSVYRDACPPSQAAMDVEDMRRVEHAFAELPEHYAEALLLVRVIGLPARSAREVLGITADSLRMILRRATVRLAHLLDTGSDERAEHGA